MRTPMGSDMQRWVERKQWLCTNLPSKKIEATIGATCRISNGITKATALVFLREHLKGQQNNAALSAAWYSGLLAAGSNVLCMGVACSHIKIKIKIEVVT